MYYMTYTAYGPSIQLSLASNKDPTKLEGWTRYGPLFPQQTLVSGSARFLLLRQELDRLPLIPYLVNSNGSSHGSACGWQ